MSEEQRHPQEPPEDAEMPEGAPGAERVKAGRGTKKDGEERAVEHPQEPAEGAAEALGARRAEGAS